MNSETDGVMQICEASFTFAAKNEEKLFYV